MGTIKIMCKRATPEVSVIIPTYNRAEFVGAAIASVLAQSYTGYEILVIDDGSTDNTPQVLARFGDKIRIIRQPNGGVARARNTGIRHARGKFICFLDSDDLWTPAKLERQLGFAKENPIYGLIATEIAGFNEAGEQGGRSKARMYRVRNGFVLEDLLFANWIQTSTVLIRRECLEAVGGFDEDVGQFGEDWLLWMRIAAQFPIYFIAEPLVRYRIHGASLTSHQPESQYESLMRILQKLETLPQFERREQLLVRACFRISMGRAIGNIKGGDYTLAIAKLRRCCELRRYSLKAKALLFAAQMGNFLHSRHHGAPA